MSQASQSLSPQRPDGRGGRCERVADVHAFHDQELPDEKRLGLENHLTVCRPCAQELDTLRRMSHWFDAANTTSAVRTKPTINELRSVQSAYRLELSLIGMAAAIMLICGGSLLSYSLNDTQKPVSLEPIVLSNDSRLAESDPLLQAMVKEYGR